MSEIRLRPNTVKRWATGTGVAASIVSIPARLALIDQFSFQAQSIGALLGTASSLDSVKKMRDEYFPLPKAVDAMRHKIESVISKVPSLPLAINVVERVLKPVIGAQVMADLAWGVTHIQPFIEKIQDGDVIAAASVGIGLIGLADLGMRIAETPAGKAVGRKISETVNNYKEVMLILQEIGREVKASK